MARQQSLTLEKAVNHGEHNEHNAKTKSYMFFKAHQLGEL